MTNIETFKQSRIFVIGDVMLDRYSWGTVDRISPEAPVPIVRLVRETVRPGGAANVAANAAALGAQVTLVGIVGDDNDAAELRSSIAELNINAHLIPSDGRRTIVKTRVLAHGQQIVRLDREDTKPLGNRDGADLLLAVTDRVDETDLVILSDYGKGTLDETLVAEIVRIFKDANKPVLADPKGKHFNKYAGATVLTPNRREAAEACKIEESDPDLVTKAGKSLLLEHSFENVLITESENGMTLFRAGDSSVHFDAAAHEVYDVTGAGDTVIGCLGVALASGIPIVEATRLANIAAGLSVQHLGTVAVSFDELAKEIKNLST